MISTIEITPESDPAQLRKVMRKKLMTGGAVIRIAPGLAAADLEAIFNRFSAPPVENETDAGGDSGGAGPARHSASALVLKELAAEPDLDTTLRDRLMALENPEVDLMLLRRSDLSPELHRVLSDRRQKVRGSGSSPWAGGATGRTGTHVG